MKNAHVYKTIIVVLLSFLIFFIKYPLNVDKLNEPELKKPKTPSLDRVLFGYQNYEEITKTFMEWDSQCPDLIDVGVYGQTSQNTNTYYLKLSNEYSPSDKVVLITSCIHGNEPLSTSTLMCFFANLINNYGKNSEITNLINSRTVYFIPVVCPDSYPHKRNSDGVDPNRNFQSDSVRAVSNLKNFFLKIDPDSVLSGHTFGKIFLIPWGDSKNYNPNHQDYKNIISKMSEYSGYEYKRACEMYGHTIHGTEIDWCHRNGAFSIVMEFGTHQKKPSLEESKKEFEDTQKAILFFIKESTEIKVQGGRNV